MCLGFFRIFPLTLFKKFSVKECSISRRDFVRIWLENKSEAPSKVYNILIDRFDILQPEEESVKKVKNHIKLLYAKVKDHVNKSSYHGERVLENWSWVDCDDLKFIFFFFQLNCTVLPT